VGAEHGRRGGVNLITETVIGAAVAVHRELGPGLLESIYETCLVNELLDRGLVVERQKPLPVQYRGRHVGVGYRLDLLVNGAVVVEVKSMERFERVHTAQMLTYLKLSGCEAGLIINFNVPLLKDGIRRVVLGLRE
jgi:GxxExxY protein